MSIILALETSCDETAVAITRDGEVLASEISSQIALHRPYGGVVPELASRSHLPQIRPLVEAATARAGLRLADVDAFAATAGPGLASSLLIGNTVAKALALAHRRPFLAINHLEGHLLSPFVGAPGGVVPCVALIVSGGHTELVLMRGHGQYERLGSTLDDAAGEAFDKVARILGLPYPGGPSIQSAAVRGDSKRFRFPRSFQKDAERLEFSFSGLKTAVLYEVAGKPPAQYDPKLLDAQFVADVAASFQEAAVDVLVTKCRQALAARARHTLLVGGGVAANSRLREQLEQASRSDRFHLVLAPLSLCTDNAAMSAIAWELLNAGHTADLDVDVTAGLVRRKKHSP